MAWYCSVGERVVRGLREYCQLAKQVSTIMWEQEKVVVLWVFVKTMHMYDDV